MPLYNGVDCSMAVTGGTEEDWKPLMKADLLVQTSTPRDQSQMYIDLVDDSCADSDGSDSWADAVEPLSNLSKEERRCLIRARAETNHRAAPDVAWASHYQHACDELFGEVGSEIYDGSDFSDVDVHEYAHSGAEAAAETTATLAPAKRRRVRNVTFGGAELRMLPAADEPAGPLGEPQPVELKDDRGHPIIDTSDTSQPPSSRTRAAAAASRSCAGLVEADAAARLAAPRLSPVQPARIECHVHIQRWAPTWV